MNTGSLWVIGVLLVAGSMLALQFFRIRRIKTAWQAMAHAHQWVFTEGSGPYYNREEFFLVAPSPNGGIQISWSAGTRGSAAQTILRTAVNWSEGLRIDPSDKLAGAEAPSDFVTGDAEYDLEFRASAGDEAALASVLDESWRQAHLANPIALAVADDLLAATTDKIIYEEEEMLAYLRLFSDFHSRLESRG